MSDAIDDAIDEAMRRVPLIYSAWDQIASDRCCDRKDACRNLPQLRRLATCDCLASAARRVREQEDRRDDE